MNRTGVVTPAPTKQLPDYYRQFDNTALAFSAAGHFAHFHRRNTTSGCEKIISETREHFAVAGEKYSDRNMKAGAKSFLQVLFFHQQGNTAVLAQGLLREASGQTTKHYEYHGN